MSNNSPVNGGCIVPNKLCVYGRKENNTVIYTVHSAAKGWTSIAIGTSMKGADFYIGWKGTSKTVLSRRTATGNRMPTPSSNQIASIIPLQKSAPSWATNAFSFSRPISSDNTITAASPYIYAYSDASPSNIDDPNSSISMHEDGDAGKITGNTNFLCSGNSCGGGDLGSDSGASAIISSTPQQYHTILMIQGLFFFFAWVVAPFVGIFIARYLKNALGVWWYRLHVMIMFGLTGVLTLIGFTLLFLYKPEHFEDIHQVIHLFNVI